MIKTLLKVLVFCLLCFAMVEQTYRVYAAGFAAFHPAKFNSMNLLLRSGLVQRSEYPDVFFELKPNLDTWMQGVRMKTNSYGMPDEEYPLEKPADAFRVAVVGSSWTMATGVEHPYTYHTLLEKELSAADPERTYEFLNYGVEFYGLREIVGTARHKTAQFQPDAIVMAVTGFTAFMRWEEPTGDEYLPEQTYPFFSSYALRALDRQLELGWYPRGVPSRPILPSTDDPLYLAQLMRAIEELDQIAEEQGIPAVFMWLSFGKPGQEIDDAIRAKTAELDIVYVDAYKSLSGPKERLRRLQNRSFDKHPNPRAHEWIALSLKEAMQANQVLPGS